MNLLDQSNTNITRDNQRLLFRQKAANAINFANARAKIRYDRKHIKLELEVGNRTYLQLHRGYMLPDMANRKLSYQQVGPFRITQKIEKLAYKLKLPPAMKIHSVVSIAQLKLAKSTDPYNKARPNHPGPVKMERTTHVDRDKVEDPQAGKIYEVEQIVRRKVQKYGRDQPRTKYRVRWLGWSPE